MHYDYCCRLSGERLKNTLLCSLLSLFVLVSTMSGAGPLGSNSNLAKVSLIQLNQETRLSFQSTSDQGFVLIAIKDCSLFIDGQSTRLKSGEHKSIPGRHSLELAQSGSAPVPLVLINVVAATQALSIQATSLAGHQELEDASDMNATLLIAITPLRLSDVRDLADEGEPWKSGPQKTFDLQEGHFAWLSRGIHRLRNSRSTAAHFVTVEW